MHFICICSTLVISLGTVYPGYHLGRLKDAVSLHKLLHSCFLFLVFQKFTNILSFLFPNSFQRKHRIRLTFNRHFIWICLCALTLFSHCIVTLSMKRSSVILFTNNLSLNEFFCNLSNYLKCFVFIYLCVILCVSFLD